MAQVFTYRDKTFVYESQTIFDLEKLYNVDVFGVVKQAIDEYIEQGQIFNTVSLSVKRTGKTKVEVKVNHE